MYTPDPRPGEWTTILLRSPIPGLPNLSRATVAGISVAITGNILISLALNCQKLAHRRLERDRELKKLQKSNGDRRFYQNGHSVKVDEEDDATQAGNGEEDTELTPTNERRPDQATNLMPRLEGSSASLTSETQPLLPSSRASAGGNEDLNPRKVTLFARLVPWAKRADHPHASSVHSLLPVDVIAVRPTDAAAENASEQDSKESDRANEGDYLKSKLWWLGFAMMNVGEMGNFISYAFAPASVVAPLGTFALIANCVFAPLMLNERFRKRDFLGVLVAVIGAVTVVLSANQSDTQLDPDALIHAIMQRVFVIYSIIYITAAVILCCVSEGSLGRRYVFIDVGLCAIFGGFTVLSTKAISTLLTKEWFEIFTEWITYPTIAVLLGTGVGQIRYLNRALMRFDSKIVVPSQFVMFNLSAIVGSAILYGDFKRASFHQIVTFLYGCAATFAGVFLIAWAPSARGPDQEDAGIANEDDIEAIAVNSEDSGLPRELRMGSLSRRDRPTLVIPEGLAESSTASPILRSRQSLVSMMGLSPAQQLLIVHTPPRDEFSRALPPDSDSSPTDHSRRRAISWMGEGSPPARGGHSNRSHVGSREGSLTRPNNVSSRRHASSLVQR